MQLTIFYFRQTKNFEKVKKVIQYLDRQGVTSRDVGIPTSLVDSKQQWDGGYSSQYLILMQSCIYAYRNAASLLY